MADNPQHIQLLSRSSPTKRSFLGYFLASYVILVFCIRWIFPERSIDATGLRAIIDSFFSVSITLIVITVASAIGLLLLRWLKPNELFPFELAIFSTPLGLGVIATGIFGLALAHWLNPVTILLWLVLLGTLFWRGVIEIVYRVFRSASDIWPIIKKLSFIHKSVASLAVLLLLLTFIQTLTPTWDADGLIYHLPIPRLWLSQGGIQPLRHFWEANYPMTVELLFAIGLTYGSDSFTKIIHFVFALIMIAGTFGFARRFAKAGFAWIAPFILVGIPIMPLWASSSYSDMGWAVFEFFSIYALMIWLETRRSAYLVIGGLFIGWGIGSKYPALALLGILGLWLLWHSRKSGLKQTLLNGITFGLPTLVGAAWYIKNWVWFQNPIYPLTLGGLIGTGDTDSLWMSYMWDGFGTGKRIWDYLLIPLNLFAHRERFSTFAGNIEIPSPLFLLALLYPLSRRSTVMNNLAVICSGHYLAWMVGVQQTRLLLPLFPIFSLLAGEFLAAVSTSRLLRRTGRVLAIGLVGGMLTVTLIYSFLLFLKTRPVQVLVGNESKSQFLSRLVDNYDGIRFILDNLPAQARVMMMWDGRGYYCDSRCIPDSDHSQWTRLFLAQPEVPRLARDLHAMGVSHLMLSRSDADFILQHDPTGEHLKAIQYYLDEFQPQCAKIIYHDDWTALSELNCR